MLTKGAMIGIIKMQSKKITIITTFYDCVTKQTLKPY